MKEPIPGMEDLTEEVPRRRSVQAAEDDDSTLARNGTRCHPMVCRKFYFSNWSGVE
jgi:hypothetical protein